MTYLLAVDSGNTRIKWGLHDGHGWLQQGAVAQNESVLLEREWQDLPEPARIMVSIAARLPNGKTTPTVPSSFAHRPRWKP